LIVLLALSAFGAEHTVAAEPSAVTVFAGKARVTRSGSLSLGTGRQEVRFTGLPPRSEMNGITADVTGGAKLLGIDMVRVTATQAADERVKEIVAETRKLKDAKLVLNEDKSAYNAQLKAIFHSRSEAAKALSAQMMVSDRAPERARAMQARLLAEETKSRSEILRLNKEIREVDAQIAKLQRERSGLGSSATDTWTATVQLEVSRAGKISLDLAYMVTGASWVPRYDLRGEPDGSVELALSAMVTQRTGEDWDGVKLTVSSAQPSRGTDTPRLDPFWLYKPRPAAPAKRSAPRASSRSAAAPMAAMAEAAPMMDMEEAYDEPMEVATAVVEVNMAATSFSVKRTEDVPSDGSERKVLLTTETLEADLRYVVVPRLDPAAYLVGEVTNSASFPLLAGKAGVFLAGAFVGEFQLPSVPPGDDFDVAFGSDDRVRVRRKPQDVQLDDKAVVGKRSRANWEWEISVHNGHKRSVPVRVQEQVPLTSREDVEVKRVADRSEPESEQDKVGLIAWEFDLAAGADRTFTWGYQVDYPSALSLGWME